MSLYAELARLHAERRAFVLATVTDTGGSTPRLAGAQMAVEAEAIWGTIGGGAFEQRAIEVARALLRDPARSVDTFEVHLVRDLAMCCGGRMRVFMQKVEAKPALRVYGAGHVGTALAEIARIAGFEVSVVDAREAWASPSRFAPEVHVHDEEPEDHLRAHPAGPEDYVVIVTHAHDLDERLLRGLASQGARYVGMIGSQGKWARFRNRLEARGIDGGWLDRVHCPVGLDIKALTPAEIAVSVVAELIAEHRG